MKLLWTVAAPHRAYPHLSGEGATPDEALRDLRATLARCVDLSFAESEKRYSDAVEFKDWLARLDAGLKP